MKVSRNICECEIRGKHMKKAHDATTKVFPCTVCEVKFSTECALKQHAKLVHDATSKLLPCTECEAKLTAEHAFRRHVKAVHKS